MRLDSIKRLFTKRRPFTKRIGIEPPAPSAGRSGCAIVIQVKDEASYIAEWAAFHKAVGIGHFFVYDHGSTDETRSVLRSILPDEMLTIVPWAFQMHDVGLDQPLNSQVIAFSHAILNFGADFRWMAFIDVDEFLLPRTGRTIDEALAGAGGFPNVSLPWHMFGTSGHKSRPPGPVTRSYTMRAADPMSPLKHVLNFKCIVDPCAVSEVSVHHFHTKEFGDQTVNDVGKRFPLVRRKSPEFYSSKYLQLNHYYTRSEDELIEKIGRGAASPASVAVLRERLLTARENIEREQFEDRALIDFLDENGIEI